MAGGVELAVGYISIVPETSKVGEGIQKALAAQSGTIAKFGSVMGTELGKGITAGVGNGASQVFEQVVRQGGEAGDKTGRDFTDHVVRHARTAGRQSGQGFFDEFKTTSERSGAIIGKIIAAPMAGTINVMQSAGGMAARAFHGALMGGLGMLGLGGGFGIMTVLNKGLQRLEGLDTAQKQLDRMSKQFQSVGKAAINTKDIISMLTNNDKTGVLDGTPFALNEAMMATTLALQGGVQQGKELTQYMTALSDAAGATQQPFNELAGVFNDIITKGRLENDEIMQLRNRMIDIPTLLKDAYGWNDKQLQDAIKNGKVGINEVTTAIEKNMGGAAKTAGDTLQGAMENVGNAVARVGAKLITAFSGNGTDPLWGMKEAVNWLTGKLDQLGGWIQAHQTELRDYFTKAKDIAVDVATAVGNIGTFLLDHPGILKTVGAAFMAWEAISATATVLTTVKGIATALGLIGPAAEAAGTAGAAGLAPLAATFGTMALAAEAILAVMALGKATQDANVLSDSYNDQLGRRGLGALNKGHQGALGSLTDAAGAGINAGGILGAGGMFGPAAGGGQGGGLPGGGGGQGYNNWAAVGAYLNQLSGGGMYGGGGNGVNLKSGEWGSIDNLAASKFNLSMTSGYRDPNGPTIAGVAANKSYHSTGQAHDFSGTPEQMWAFANYMADNYGPQLKELIFDAPGFNRTINNGAVKGPFGAFYTMGQAGDHKTHVHIAFAGGGGISGPGSGTSDSIPAMLSNGEHVLTAADVTALGGQDGVYKLRAALHRAGGGQIDFDPNSRATNQLPAPDQLTKAQQETGTGSYSAAILDALQHAATSGNINPNWQIDTRSSDNFAGAAGPLTPLVNPASDKYGPLSALQPGNMRTDWINLQNSMEWDKPMWSKSDLANSPLGGILDHTDPEASRNKLNDTNWTEWITPSNGGEPYLQYVGTNHFARGGAVQRFAGGGKPLTPEEIAAEQTGAAGYFSTKGGSDAPGQPVIHQGTGAAPGDPTILDPNSLVDPNAAPSSDQPASFFDNLMANTMGYMPTGGGGTAGTSSLAKMIGMGSSVVNGLIDTGASLANMAVTAAIGAGSMGAAAAAGPAAGFGINMAAGELKTLSSFWLGSVPGIAADALTAQLFPIGGPPRWLGYDYTQFMPQLGIMDAANTTIQQMGQKAINDYFNPQKGQPGQPGQLGQPGAGIGGTPIGADPGIPAAAQSNNGPSAPVATLPTPPGQGTGPAPGPAVAPSAIPSAPVTAPSQQQQLDPLALFGFDQGGWLQPNQLGVNMTGRPEPVLTPQQWDSLASNPSAGGNGGPMVKIDAIYGMNPEDVANEIEQKQRIAALRYTGRPYN
jgi:hypothetical protein